MRNAIPKVGLFLCSLFLLTTSSVGAISSKQLALTEDPFHYRESAEKEDEAAKQKEEAEAKEDEQKAEEEAKKEVKPVEKQVVQHTVLPGESLAKIAASYGTSWTRLYAKNTQIAQPDIINVNDVITVPDTAEVLPERALPLPVAEPVAVTPIASSKKSKGISAPRAPRIQARGSSAGNTYSAGYCTWYAKSRRPDLPNRMGNASAWVASAAAQGFATGSTPRPGAIGQQGNHVVYIESVNGDGTVTVSEMNYRGLGVVSSRTASAGSFRYIY